MLTEDQKRCRPWILYRDERQQREVTSTTGEVKRIQWPPRSAGAGSFDRDDENIDNEMIDYRSYGDAAADGQDQRSSASPSKVPPRVPPKPHVGSEGQQAMVYQVASAEQGDRTVTAKPPAPSGLLPLCRPLKQQPFLHETQHPVYSSQPVFKRSITPVRMLGDMVWPPKGTGTSSRASSMSPGTVRRQNKDYRRYFNQNQLTPSFPTYRAPPGTQHIGFEDGANATAM